MVVKDLDEHRKLRQLQTSLMWRLLNRIFDGWNIPYVKRHKLMCVDLPTFEMWGMGHKLMLKPDLERVEMYGQLHAVLVKLCNGRAQVPRWLHTENSAFLCGGMSPIESIIQGGEHTLGNLLEDLKRLASKGNKKT